MVAVTVALILVMAVVAAVAVLFIVLQRQRLDGGDTVQLQRG